MKKISILIPTYNEEENVNLISERIIEQFRLYIVDYDYEIIFIDNCSKDNTQDEIRHLCKGNPKIKAIFNARNYGQFSSPFYGLLQATGDCVIGMCADFQDPVEIIPEYVKWWESGYKIVLGQKTSSKESRLTYGLRNLYYRSLKKRSGIEFLEHVTGSGLYDREFIEVMRDLDDPRPFLRGIIAEMGYKIKLIEYEQPKRERGKSSNNIFKYYDAAIQSFTTYTKTGVRVAVALGIFFTIASIITAISACVYKIFNWGVFDLGAMALNLIIFIAVSLQILFIGVIGEYVLEINSRVRKRPLVVELERINF